MQLSKYYLRALAGVGIMMLGGVGGCGQQLQKIKTPADPVSVVLDARGEQLYIACQSAKKIVCWDVKKRRQTSELSLEAEPTRLYLAPQLAQLMVICQNPFQLRWISLPGLKTVKVLDLPDRASAWGQGGEREENIFACPDANLVRRFSGHNPMPVIEAGLGPADIFFQPDKDTLWIANAKSNEVALAKTRQNLVIKRIPVWANPIRLAMGPREDKFFVLCQGREAFPARSVIQLVDQFYQTAGLTWQAGEYARDFSLDSLGRNLFVADEKMLRVISARTGIQVLERPLGPDPQSVAVSPDGLRVYVACRGDNTVHIFAFKKNEMLGQ